MGLSDPDLRGVLPFPNTPRPTARAPKGMRTLHEFIISRPSTLLQHSLHFLYKKNKNNKKPKTTVFPESRVLILTVFHLSGGQGLLLLDKRRLSSDQKMARQSGQRTLSAARLYTSISSNIENILDITFIETCITCRPGLNYGGGV
jgi:hypothetical protein